MQQIELLVIHMLMKYAKVEKVFDLWNSPQLQGFRTYASLAILGLVYELHKYNLPPMDNESVYQGLKAFFSTAAVLGTYEKFQRAHPQIEMVQGVLDDLVTDIKKDQTKKEDAPK